MGGKHEEHKNILAGLCEESIKLLTEKGFIIKLVHGVHALTEEGREVLMEAIKKLEFLNVGEK